LYLKVVQWHYFFAIFGKLVSNACCYKLSGETESICNRSYGRQVNSGNITISVGVFFFDVIIWRNFFTQRHKN